MLDTKFKLFHFHFPFIFIKLLFPVFFPIKKIHMLGFNSGQGLLKSFLYVLNLSFNYIFRVFIFFSFYYYDTPRQLFRLYRKQGFHKL